MARGQENKKRGQEGEGEPVRERKAMCRCERESDRGGVTGDAWRRRDSIAKGRMPRRTGEASGRARDARRGRAVDGRRGAGGRRPGRAGVAGVAWAWRGRVHGVPCGPGSGPLRHVVHACWETSRQHPAAPRPDHRARPALHPTPPHTRPAYAHRLPSTDLYAALARTTRDHYPRHRCPLTSSALTSARAASSATIVSVRPWRAAWCSGVPSCRRIGGCRVMGCSLSVSGQWSPCGATGGG